MEQKKKLAERGGDPFLSMEKVPHLSVVPSAGFNYFLASFRQPGVTNSAEIVSKGQLKGQCQSVPILKPNTAYKLQYVLT